MCCADVVKVMSQLSLGNRKVWRRKRQESSKNLLLGYEQTSGIIV